MTNEPPLGIIKIAENQAALGPCAKSKRGVVTWVEMQGSQIILATAFNSPPAPLTCLQTSECMSTCNKRCVHAESRALRKTWESIHLGNRADFSITEVQMLHVKVVSRPGLPTDGKVVPGGPPSCWQCSREILDMNIAGIWLYQLLPDAEYTGKWMFYTPLDFHTATLKHCAQDPKNADLWTVYDRIQLLNIKNDGHSDK